MTYKGYRITREVQGWKRELVSADGSVELIEFLADPDAAVWYYVDSPDNSTTEEFESLEDAVSWIDATTEKAVA